MKSRRLTAVFALLLAVSLLAGCGKAEPSALLLKFDAALERPQAEMTLPELAAAELTVFDEKTEEEEFPKVSAALLSDETTHEAVVGEHVYDRLYPASITKIFTAYMALKYGNLEDTVKVSYNASHISVPGAQLCKLQEGDQVNLRNLLQVMLLYSGNDTALAIAEHISGSVEAFCEKMNEEAKLLGCADTHLVNPHGLHEDDHYTTAYDIYLVMRELLKNETFCELVHCAEESLHITHADGSVEDRKFVATNRYFSGNEKYTKVDEPGSVELIGGKTGTTGKAGYCLVLGSTGKTSGDLYISLILNASSSDELYKNMTALLEKAE